MHLAVGLAGTPKEPDAWICEINESGVLVMPNSGGATADLTHGLNAKHKAQDVAAMITALESEEGSDYCSKSENGLHTPNADTVAAAKDLSGVVDVSCVHCGRSGSFRVDPQDINW